MTNALVSTKKFVSKHRVAIAVVATVVTCVAINRQAVKEHNDFLKDHGLFDEYYNLNEI